MIPKDALSILELGCGNGPLVSYIPKETHYLGIDFSKEALKEAAREHPNRRFVLSDLYRLPQDFYQPGWVIVSCETFEHLRYWEILRRIPEGTTIVFSVPTYDFESHLEHFPTKLHLEFMFGPYIDFEEVYLLNEKVWCCRGKITRPARITKE